MQWSVRKNIFSLKSWTKCLLGREVLYLNCSRSWDRFRRIWDVVGLLRSLLLKKVWVDKFLRPYYVGFGGRSQMVFDRNRADRVGGLGIRKSDISLSVDLFFKHRLMDCFFAGGHNKSTVWEVCLVKTRALFTEIKEWRVIGLL